MTFINFTDAQYADTAQHWSTTHWLGGYVQGGYLADQKLAIVACYLGSGIHGV